jgi:hypothetical protein
MIFSAIPSYEKIPVESQYGFSHCIYAGFLCLDISYTVTRIDVIFRYPDRVPLTHFVYRAKKFLACEPEFSVGFSVPPVFSGGVIEKCLSTR